MKPSVEEFPTKKEAVLKFEEFKRGFEKGDNCRGFIARVQQVYGEVPK